jgi:hypothetical protein
MHDRLEQDRTGEAGWETAHAQSRSSHREPPPFSYPTGYPGIAAASTSE